MKLKLFTDYALHALIYLAEHPDRTVTALEIAQHYGLSRDHVVKVVQELQRHGFVTARRGRGGGSVLARSAAEISLLEVINTFEGSNGLLGSHEHAAGPRRPHPQLQQAMDEAESRMHRFLRNLSLADVIRAAVLEPSLPA